MAHPTAGRETTPAPTQPTLGLAALALLLFVIFTAAGIDSAVWLVVGAIGLAAAASGWRAGAAQTRGPLLSATLVGAGIAALVVVWAIFGS